jgi:hypothetical protein
MGAPLLGQIVDTSGDAVQPCDSYDFCMRGHVARPRRVRVGVAIRVR